MSAHDRRHLLPAVVASLLVHAVLLALWGLMPAPEPAPTPKAEEQLAVQIIQFPPVRPPIKPAQPKPAPEPQPKTSEKLRAPKKRSGEDRVAQAPPSKGRPDGQPSMDPLAEGTQGGGDPGDSPNAGDAPAPRLKTLVPDGSFAGRLEPVPGAPGSGRGSGRTIHNKGDPSAEELHAAREAEAREVGKRVGTWARDDLAEVRVRSGVVDHYFRQLGKELEKLAQVERPLKLEIEEGLRRSVDGYLMDVAKYGATGAPHLPGGDFPEHTTNFDPNGRHEIAAATADQYARVQELAQRFGAGELVVVVELAQDANGRIHHIVLVQSSGDPVFDAHIQKIAAKLETLEGMPDYVAARNPNGVRTTWEFRGRYEFRKKLREMNVENPADAAYLTAVGLGSLILGGAFDETTGDIYVIDVRDPRFDVRAKLLRLY